MEYIMGGTIIRAIGLNLTLGCLNRITSSAQSIYTLIGYVNGNSKYSDVGETIQKLDLDLKIRVLESLMKNLKTEKHSEALQMCLTALGDCLISIEKELCDVYTKTNFNRSIKIMRSYRAQSFENNIKKLCIYSDTLDSRKELLFEILGIDKHLHSEQSAILENKKTNDKTSYVPITTEEDNFILVGKPKDK